MTLPLLIVCHLAAATGGPVAVMPFRNLNDDPSLEWLRVGMAETMVSDLKREHGLGVVERAQVDRALTELALQGEKSGEESQAAKVGKLVGAKVVVLGSFQKAGQDLRISARFVTVETGVVEGAAKVTGKLDEVFALQDQVVAALAGRPDLAAKKAAPKKQARKGGKKTVAAYRLYAMSLATASDADRVSYLQRSLEEDPGFSYSVEALAALEERMRGYREKSQGITQSRLDQALAGLNLDAPPSIEADAKLFTVYGELISQKRFHALLLLSQRVEGRTAAIPNHDWKRSALGWRFTALRNLQRVDEAMAVGEKILANYPGTPEFGQAEMMMNALIDQKRREVEHRERYEKDRAKLADDKEPKPHPSVGEERAALMRAYFATRGCLAAGGWSQHEETLKLCPPQLAAIENEPGDGVAERRYLIRRHILYAFIMTSRFDEARQMIAEMKRTDPKRFEARTYAGIIEMVPADRADGTLAPPVR